MATLSEQMEEARSQAEQSLSMPGSAQEIKTGVSSMANIPLPPSAKYRYIAAEAMVIDNSAGNTRKEVRLWSDDT